MYRSCWTQHISDCAIEASSEIKVWLWDNALAKDL
jgi:hypothetical protein